MASLVDKGLVSRHAKSEDLRAAVLRLTERGSAVYRDLVPDALGFAQRLTEGLTAEETELLDRLMNRLITRSETLAEPRWEEETS